MSKFAQKGVRPAARGPISTMVNAPDISTFEGAPAKQRTAKSDLFLLAAANMVGEDTFYEAASDRDARFRSLVHAVAVEDFDWLARFVPFLRTQMFMRSASVVAAAEAVWARLNSDGVGTGAVLPPSASATNREVIASAIQRLDEPAEMLAYWQSRYGRAIPKPVKRGVADAFIRLTNEYAAMKYDGTGRDWRLGDVIDLVHPQPTTPWQGDLFAYLLDRRHHAGDVRVSLDRLPKIAERRRLEEMPVEARREWLRHHMRNLSQTEVSVGGALGAAGATWEWLSGWLPGGMDAEAWEAVIPSMGYMALLRNLRNFDDAGVSDEVADKVAAFLTDPAQVARSKQFPFRFWSAHQASAGSMRWGRTLSWALDLATSNVPEFSGRTLVLVDTSNSMSWTPISKRSSMTPVQAAAVFGAAVAKRNAGKVDLVHFASSAEGIGFRPSESVLTLVQRLTAAIGRVGHGTDVNAGLEFFNGHDRVIVFSDEQIAYRARWPRNVPLYVWNLMGYAGSLDYDGTVVELGGMSDAAFRLVPMIEAGKSADWPF